VLYGVFFLLIKIAMKKTIAGLSIIFILVMTGLYFNTKESDVTNKVLCAEKGTEFFENIKDTQPWIHFLDPKYVYDKTLETCLIAYYSVEDGGDAGKVTGNMIVDVLTNNTLFYSIQYIVSNDIEKEQMLNETSRENCINDVKCLSDNEIQKKINEWFD